MSSCRNRKRARATQSSAHTSPTTSPLPSRSPSPVPTNKKSRFEKRYNMANTSDNDVLGMSTIILSYSLVTHVYKAKQKASWTSDVYDHYQPPCVVHDGDNVRYVFLCKKYIHVLVNSCLFTIVQEPSIKVSRAHHNESTSNLVRHVDNCSPSDSTSNLVPFAQRFNIHGT
jgi:hypothetical protein